MAVLENRPECSGCGACANICPKGAIKMVEDKGSFLTPHVDKELCVECGLCEKTCPVDHTVFLPVDEVRAYVGRHNSDDVYFNSSSGGAFIALCEIYIKKGYKIHGAEFTEDLRVIHSESSSLEDCERFRKSKYIQSSDNGCYERAASDLKAGNKVLFSGTPCQCAALDAYLKAKDIRDTDLVTVSVLCHGVPSQKMFDSYIKEEERAEGAKVVSYTFRNKLPIRNKVNSRTAYAEFDNGKKYIRTMEKDPFLRGYYRHLFFRESCYLCKYARKERVSDFTISDAWNIERIRDKYDTLTGTSLLLLNSEKAKSVLGEIEALMSLEEIPADWALVSQKILSKPTPLHRNRDMFFSLWPEKGFRQAVFESTRATFRERIAALIPSGIRNRLIAVLYPIKPDK